MEGGLKMWWGEKKERKRKKKEKKKRKKKRKKEAKKEKGMRKDEGWKIKWEKMKMDDNNSEGYECENSWRM